MHLVCFLFTVTAFWHILNPKLKMRNSVGARRYEDNWIKKKINVPILHIVDATANVIKRDGRRKVALLGTRFTMTQDFIKERLVKAGLEVLVPCEEDIAIVDDVIFNELCLGKIIDSSREKYRLIIEKMKALGAEGVILGCTEIGMLISQKDSVLPVYDTTLIHAAEAARLQLE